MKSSASEGPDDQLRILKPPLQRLRSLIVGKVVNGGAGLKKGDDHRRLPGRPEEG
jgi:hypothetical protein